MISFLFAGVAVVAVVAVAVAFKKHHTLAAVVASAKKEIANVEAFVAKVDTAAKADFTAAVAKLKSIF